MIKINFQLFSSNMSVNNYFKQGKDTIPPSLRNSLRQRYAPIMNDNMNTSDLKSIKKGSIN